MRQLKQNRHVNLLVLAYQNGMRENIFSTASSLTYSTLMALVPAFAFYSAFFGAFGVLNVFMSSFGRFLTDTFGAEIAAQFVEWIGTNSRNALSLGVIGLLSFLWTMTLLLNKVWTEINRIYHTSMRRTLVNRFAGIFLFIAFSLVFGGVYLSLQGKMLWYGRLLGLESLFGMKMTTGCFRFGLLCLGMYLTISFVPSTKVRFRSAMLAAFYAAIGFFVSNMILGGLTSMVTRYSVLYGSLAAVFLILFRVYVLWMIGLWAVEFAYVHQFRPDEQEFHGLPESPALQLSDGINIMMLIGANFRDGKGGTSTAEMVERLAIPGYRLYGFLDLLESLRFIQPVAANKKRYTVARPLGDLRIYQLANALYGLGTLGPDDKDTAGEAVARAVRDDGVESLGELTVENLLERV